MEKDFFRVDLKRINKGDCSKIFFKLKNEYIKVSYFRTDEYNHTLAVLENMKVITLNNKNKFNFYSF